MPGFTTRTSARLLSLMLTDTGSETQPIMYHPDGREITSEGTIRELLDFLDCVAMTGRANR